ncbi:hypothetical protein C8F04DRAFT_114070 [Mycena alexandri]|uniref:Uncharacterized protein n=1 Tax=Mycena alexandri TaxID=1745969 RepID=A0AAD6XBK4_9AGAR|nr:hypothetical protein C8F04DRAFT_114070 [Mycena alexandri]
MAIPASAIVDATSRPYGPKQPAPTERIRHRLEWSWGLEYGGLDGHLGAFFDPHFASVLMDDNLILLAHSDVVEKLHFAASIAPCRFVKSHDPYNGSQSFEYLVLPVDLSSQTPPRLLISSVPPHLTISSSLDKLFKFWGYTSSAYKELGSSIIKLVQNSPPTGATFVPDKYTFVFLRYIHESWATCHVPSRFLGGEGCDEEESDDESSSMEWEVVTVALDEEEPQRRLLPHELKADPIVVNFRVLPAAADEGDDAISCDSYITGLEGKPEEFSKASMARAKYDDEEAAWEKGIESWAQSASIVADDRMLLNDDQIEEDPKEQPRVATTLDLHKPDYLARQEKVR